MLRRALLSLCLLALAACGGDGAGAPASPPPNVLVIAVDTLRADHLGAYGYAKPTSPAIDALLAKAVVFDDAHSSSSWTLPSFASLWTSQYSSAHGCWQFDHALDPSFTTLAEVLAGHGYETKGIVSHLFLASNHGLDQGFQDYDQKLVQSTLLSSHMAISSPAVTDKALAFLDGVAAGRDGAEPGAEPWLLFVHYFDPHDLYQPHPGITEKFGSAPIDRYDGEIAFTDSYIGALLERLQKDGLADDTIVVFVSDHGEEFREHGGTGHGASLYREVEHVALAIRAPGIAPRRVPEPVSLVDVMPTVLDLLSISNPVPMAGISLLPAMRGGSVARDGVLLESRLDKRPDVDLAGFVDARWKLIVETPKPGVTGQPKVMLFDRGADPQEQNDVADRLPDVAAALHRRLDAAVADAVRQGEAFEASQQIGLSDEERRSIAQLGYTGSSHGRDPLPPSRVAEPPETRDPHRITMTAMGDPTPWLVDVTPGPDGLRRRTPLPEELTGTRVLALGDSQLQGLLPIAENATSRLETALREDPGGEVWVLNAAHAGASLYDDVVQARTLLPRYRPAVLMVVVFGGNDFLELDGVHGPHLDDELREQPAVPLDRPQVVDAYLTDPARLISGLAQAHYLDDHQDRTALLERKAEHSVELLQQAAAAHGTRVLWVLLPSFDLVFPEMVEEEGGKRAAAANQRQRQLYGWFGDLLHSRGEHVVDLLGPFREKHDVGFYATDLHVFVRGHHELAEVVLPELREMLR